MIGHYIIMSSSYSIGTRIALHYLLDDSSTLKLNRIVPIILKECGRDVSISSHFIETDDKSFQSVVDKDYFFKDVKVIDSLEEFIKLINIDRELIGLDVAKYILCRCKCTHLKLEKLVYMCYAEYLCKYNKKLYEDSIYAYKYGPVVKTVYEKYKKYGYKEIERDDETIDASDVFEMPSRSRILFAKDGTYKIFSIDSTINKYGGYTSSQLVDLTHKYNSPWSVSGSGTLNNKVIDDEVILKYHCNEI